VSLFTSNKHPRRTSIECERIASSFYLFLPSPLKVLSLDVSSHPLTSPTVKRAFVRLRSTLLKIIYIYIFVCFYTGYTLLPNNTINRCFLPLLLPQPPFSIWTRGSCTKMTIDTDFCSRPLQSFWKITVTRRPPCGIPKGYPARFVLRPRDGRKMSRDILRKSRIILSSVFLSLPLQLLSHFRIIYVRLFSRKKHTRVVKPLKSKNHNVFGTQASESFTSSDQSMDNQSIMTDNDNANDHSVSHLCTTSRASYSLTESSIISCWLYAWLFMMRN